LGAAAAEAFDLLHEKDVGRLGNGNGQDSLDKKQGQNLVFFEEFARKNVNDLGIGDARSDAGVGNAVGLGERFDDLVFGAEPKLDENFAQELLVIGSLLFQQRAVEVLRLEEALSTSIWPRGFRSAVAIMVRRAGRGLSRPPLDGSLHVLHCLGHVGATLESMIEPRHFQDFAAVLVELGKLDATEHFLAGSLDPEQRFQTLGIDESAFSEIDNEFDDAAAVDALLHDFAYVHHGVAGEIALDLQDADVPVIVAFDVHRVSPMAGAESPALSKSVPPPPSA